jgi:hypothetical protein
VPQHVDRRARQPFAEQPCLQVAGLGELTEGVSGAVASEVEVSSHHGVIGGTPGRSAASAAPPRSFRRRRARVPRRRRESLSPVPAQRSVDNRTLKTDHVSMTSDRDDPHADNAQAERERRAQTRLTALAADAIAPRPWRPAPVPPSAVDLAHFALWRTRLEPDDLLHALTLLPAARAEIEGLEAGLLLTARSAGLTWAQIAHAMGFRSPQACQQHYTRLTARQDARS